MTEHLGAYHVAEDKGGFYIKLPAKPWGAYEEGTEDGYTYKMIDGYIYYWYGEDVKQFGDIFYSKEIWEQIDEKNRKYLKDIVMMIKAGRPILTYNEKSILTMSKLKEYIDSRAKESKTQEALGKAQEEGYSTKNPIEAAEQVKEDLTEARKMPLIFWIILGIFAAISAALFVVFIAYFSTLLVYRAVNRRPLRIKDAFLESLLWPYFGLRRLLPGKMREIAALDRMVSFGK